MSPQVVHTIQGKVCGQLYLFYKVSRSCIGLNSEKGYGYAYIGPDRRKQTNYLIQLHAGADVIHTEEEYRGGSGEIRTHGCLAASPVFKTGAFNRSATLPERPF